MAIVSIFTCSDELPEIFQTLKDEGFICLPGGRVAVRKKLKELDELIETEGLGEKFIHLTYNHPDTELGFAYEAESYGIDEAKRLAISAYNKQNA